jgi:hypothetical protein
MNRTQRNWRLVVDVATTVVCALGAAFTLGDVHTPLRSGLVATALVVGTGWAATNWITFSEAAFAATVALATGLSIFFLYALFFVEIGWWHPIGSVGALLVVAAALNAAAVLRDTLRKALP